ncbi:hypothetical protein KI387_010942, partial [Taxus chinensis]
MDVAQNLHAQTKHIKESQMDGKHIQVFEDLKLSTDKYVLHSDFYALDMDGMDIVLRYPWLETLGTININVQKKFMKLWYKRKKITLQDITLSKEKSNVKLDHEDEFEDGEEGNKDELEGDDEEHDEKVKNSFSTQEKIEIANKLEEEKKVEEKIDKVEHTKTSQTFPRIGKMESMHNKEQQSPYKIEMDPDKALELVKHGASLLLLNIPPSTHFGIDTQMFTVGPNFKGMKMIPPGPHFVYYSAVSRYGNESSPVIGFFIFASSSEVIVKQWDPHEERLVKFADSSEEERFAHGVKNLEFDRYLAAYDIHHYQDWKQITSCITKNVIERIEPVGGEITIISESELIAKGPQTAAERRLMEQLPNAGECHGQKAAVSGKHKSARQRCFYTPIPISVRHKGMTAEELTAANLEKTQLLEMLLEQKYGGCEDLLLGEFQFSFIAFLMGQSLEAFGQWKAILCLLLSCEEAPLRTRTQFFFKFLEVVYFQLKQGFQTSSSEHEQGNFPFVDDSWFSEDNFLQLMCKEFFSIIREAQPVDGELLFQAKRLKKMLEGRLGWCFDNVAYNYGENDE